MFGNAISKYFWNFQINLQRSMVQTLPAIGAETDSFLPRTYHCGKEQFGLEPAMSNPPLLFDVMRHKMRVRHRSLRTEKTYRYWVRQFIRFHRSPHPRALGVAEVEQFLTDLAVRQRVAPAIAQPAEPSGRRLHLRGQQPDDGAADPGMHGLQQRIDDGPRQV